MNIKKTVLVLVATLVISGGAYAMGHGSDGTGGDSHKGKPNVEHMQKELNLNDSQVTSLKQLFKEQGDKHKEMRDRMNEKLSEILTPEQLEDFKMMKQKRCQKR